MPLMSWLHFSTLSSSQLYFTIACLISYMHLPFGCTQVSLLFVTFIFINSAALDIPFFVSYAVFFYLDRIPITNRYVFLQIILNLIHYYNYSPRRCQNTNYYLYYCIQKLWNRLPSLCTHQVMAVIVDGHQLLVRLQYKKFKGRM